MLKRLKTVSMMLFLMGASAGTAYAATNLSVADAKVTQQSNACKGVVVDATGETVIGAAVVIKGTTTGTVTGLDGDFIIENAKVGDIIQISFVGYKTAEIKWDGKPIRVVLSDDTQALEEVVVTALGIKKDAKKLGYSVASVGAGDLVKTASPNLGSALYGKAAGVRIQNAPGGATGSISINVRGLSSITGTNQPLIVVDGVPIHNGDANNEGYWENQRVQSNGLADINPEDIENLSILKGASASALYGSEGANGVVLITTKSGKGAKGFGVDFNASITGDFVAYMPQYQTTFGPGAIASAREQKGCDPEGFYQRKDRNGVMQDSYLATNQYFGPRYDGREVLYFDGTKRKFTPQVDDPWNEVFRTGLSQQYNLAITKGSDKGNMRFSYTYVDNKPTQYNSSFKKHNFAINGSYNITDNVKIDYSTNYILQSIKNRPYRMTRLVSNFGGMFGPFDDVAYVRDHAVTQAGYRNRVWTAADHENPAEGWEFGLPFGALVDEYFWNIYGKEQVEHNNRLIASVTPNWEIVKGLNLRARIATDYTTEKIELNEKTHTSSQFGRLSGYYGIENKRYEIYYGDVMLMFDHNFGEKFGVTATAGWQARSENAFNMKSETRNGLTVENWFHLNASKDAPRAKQYKSEFLKTAFFGTASVSYDSWAYLEGTVRQEKISTLAPGNNSFFYPSVNGSVIISELLKDKKPTWFDYGKVRVSYGIVGNAPAIYKSTQGYNQASASGFVYNQLPKSVGNRNIKPEKKYEWEFGLEGKFLGNRLGFEASYYMNTVKDQILNTTMPISSGAESILLNVGELKNKGFEMSVYGTPIQTKDWNWDVRANIAWNRNKVTKLMDGVDILQHSNWDNGSAYLYSRVGQPMGDIFALAPARDDNGNLIVREDGFYKLTDKHVKVGNAMPKLTGGFATSVGYKNFFLDASLDFRIGGAVFNMPYQFMMGRGAIVESMAHRGAENGGLPYYLDAENNCVPVDKGVKQGPNGEKIYDDGMILKGVTEDGKENNKMIEASKYYLYTYNWGGYDPSDVTHYSNSIFDNTYVKVREITFGYNLPKSITEKFHCQKLQLSVYGRNLFYIYKNLPIFDAEATDGTSWINQAMIGGSSATTRSFGLSVRASF